MVEAMKEVDGEYVAVVGVGVAAQAAAGVCALGRKETAAPDLIRQPNLFLWCQLLCLPSKQ